MDTLGNLFIGTGRGLDVSSHAAIERADSVKRAAVEKADSLKYAGMVQTLKASFVLGGLDDLGYMDEFLRDFEQFIAKGNVGEGDEIMDQVRGLDSKNVISTYISLSALFAKMGDDNHASVILGKVLSIDPGNRSAQHKLVQIYYSTGEYDKVIAKFGNTNDIDCLRYLALSYEKEARLVEANKTWQAIAKPSKVDSLTAEAASPSSNMPARHCSESITRW